MSDDGVGGDGPVPNPLVEVIGGMFGRGRNHSTLCDMVSLVERVEVGVADVGQQTLETEHRLLLEPNFELVTCDSGPY